ncbi:hydantoinase B/oxoprolinase family protein [Leucobacter denitrificans]|uniref:Hydantoinase B/oxoprolinase family protein n=1 Tax=Leucobacter denitrificans TaxID=683042 RepID=A0A7G9S2P7_9MICO|nr:hydantoinase B/oxoprolinase family protein [Leucobacter denitrificans]QNN62122.1 hydantoinase B/oxoprolinase family protein [Leucobacter denitrificans]
MPKYRKLEDMTSENKLLIDSVSVDILGNHLLATAEEMGVALIRAAYSPNIKERRDCSTSLLDREGRTIAQAEHIPLHMGSMFGFIPRLLEQFGDDIHEGDVFLSNDPYVGGSTHLPDVSVVAPMFADGKLAGFAASVAHHAEMGGSLGGAPDIFSEGLRIPPVKIISGGLVDDQVMRFILNNCRAPLDRRGDLRAQFAAVRLGVQRYADLCEKYGPEYVLQATELWLDKAEQQVRSALEKVTPGTYSFVDYIDYDGAGTEDIEIKVAVSISADNVSVDFSGTSSQVPGQINVVPSALDATVYYAIKAALDPELPANSGFYRVIDIQAERGSILNPIDPAPVWSRSDTCQRVAEAILGALAPALPDRIPAASHGSIPSIHLHGRYPESGQFFSYVESYGGGFGASPAGDGPDGVHSHLTNTANTPNEVMEIAYPFRIKRYGLRSGSGGEGHFRGGEGIVREIETLVPGVRLRTKGDRVRTGPWGLAGGGAGSTLRVTIDPETDQEWIYRREDNGTSLPQGSIIRIETAGGGGYGQPEAAAGTVSAEISQNESKIGGGK